MKMEEIKNEEVVKTGKAAAPALSAREKNRNYISTITGLGILTAMVVVLQLLSSVIKFGPFSITLALTPIIVGGALYGVFGGAWLGFVMGATVLLSGDATAFLTVNAAGTILTVLLKSTSAGLNAALRYRALEKKNKYVASVVAGITAPIFNTGIFLIGTALFFLDTINSWAGQTPIGEYIVFGMIGANFIVELLVNLALSIVTVTIIDHAKKIMKNR